LSSLLDGFRALPPYGVGALIVLLLYAVQSEIRFGAKARTIFAGRLDRGSTIALTLSAAVPVLGFALAMKANQFHLSSWFGRSGAMPGMPAIAWIGVGAGGLGLLLRLWAVLVLRERYTRTLLVDKDQAI
jgi:hypothetical protein